LAGRNLDHRVLFDVVADLLAPLDLFGQPRQAFRVEGVGRIEEFHAGLVELGQRHGFEFQPVLQQVAGDPVAHAAHEVATLLVKFLHCHLGGHGAQRVDELALHQFLEHVGLHRPCAQGLGGIRDGLHRRLHPDIELRDHVHPHPVLGDQGLVASARDLQAKGVHVDGNNFVNDRQHERSPVHDHLLPAKAGADERTLLGGAQVQPVQQPDQDRCHDGNDDQPQDKCSEL
jgi:hypothetical protein